MKDFGKFITRAIAIALVFIGVAAACLWMYGEFVVKKQTAVSSNIQRFIDLDPTLHDIAAIEKVVDAGIIQPTGQNTFAPDEHFYDFQFAKVLHRLSEKAEKEPDFFFFKVFEAPNSDGTLKYSSHEEYTTWGIAIANLQDMGILITIPEGVDLSAAITRYELAELLAPFLAEQDIK